MSSFVWLSVFPSFDEPRSRSSNSPLEVVLAVVAHGAGLDVLQDDTEILQNEVVLLPRTLFRDAVE